MPVQRVPRYILLFSDLGKRTPVEHPDHFWLKRALVKVSEIADWVDEQKTQYDRSQEMVKLDNSLQQAPKNFGLVVPGRLLIKEGELNITGTAHYLFLFSDMLLITKRTEEKKKKKKDEEDGHPKYIYTYTNHVLLKTAAILDYPENQTYKYAISISCGGHSFLIQSTSEAEKSLWFKEFNKCLENLKIFKI